MLRYVAFVLLLKCVHVSSSSSGPFYSYASSDESTISSIVNIQLASLPVNERTIAAAVNLCQMPGDQSSFCAWVQIDSAGVAVSVACFSEYRRQCNRRSPSGVDANREIKENNANWRLSKALVRENRNDTRCELCTPCAQTHWSSCPTCRLVCYCTCAYETIGLSKPKAIGDLRIQVYPCHQFCDTVNDCLEESHLSTDERGVLCNYYKQKGNPSFVILRPWQRVLYYLFCYLAPALFICWLTIVSILTLTERRCTFTSHVIKMRKAPLAEVIVNQQQETLAQPMPLTDEAVEQQHLLLQAESSSANDEQVDNNAGLPPPPDYADACLRLTIVPESVEQCHSEHYH